jgi:hypothetical protein
MEPSVGREMRGQARAVALEPTGGAAARLREEAAAWGVTPRRAVILALVPPLAALAFVAVAPFPGLFHWMIDEDSALETLQFTLILATCGAVTWLSVRLLRNNHVGIGLLYVLLALATFFIAGEEISWGQRIFGWSTPPALERINAQQEISVHNIQGLHQPFIIAVMLAGLYGTAMPLLRLGLPARWRRSGTLSLLIPPLFLIPAFLMPFGYRFVRLVFRPEQYVAPGYRVFVITEFNELTELTLYFGLLAFAWLNLRRLRRGPGELRTSTVTPRHGGGSI